MTLPKLVEGKVAVIYFNEKLKQRYYKLYTVSSLITIEDNFNPLDYCILNNKKWKDLIVYSRKEERQEFLVNAQLKNSLFGIGDKIHIHSRRGVYEVVSLNSDSIVITCKKWQYTDTPFRIVQRSDFQCLAGELYNHNF